MKESCNEIKKPLRITETVKSVKINRNSEKMGGASSHHNASKSSTKSSSDGAKKSRNETNASKKLYKKHSSVYPSNNSNNNSYYESFRLKNAKGSTPTPSTQATTITTKTAITNCKPTSELDNTALNGGEANRTGNGDVESSTEVILRNKDANNSEQKLDLVKSATTTAVIKHTENAENTGAEGKKEIHKSGCTYHKTNTCYVKSDNGKYYKLPSDTYHKLNDGCYIKLSNGSFKHLIYKNINKEDDKDDSSSSSNSNLIINPNTHTNAKSILSSRVSTPAATTSHKTETTVSNLNRDKLKSYIVSDNSNGVTSASIAAKVTTMTNNANGTANTTINANVQQPQNRKVMVTMIDGGLPVVAKAIDKHKHSSSKKEKIKVRAALAFILI